MTNFTVVTTLNRKIWDDYGETTLNTWFKNLSKDVKLIVYLEEITEDDIEKEFPEHVEVRYLADIESLQDFIITFGAHPRPQTEPGMAFRFNFLPFAKKVFSIIDAFKYDVSLNETQYLIWIDADVLMKESVGVPDFDKWTQDFDFATLNRGGNWWSYESGFLAFKETNKVLCFLEDMSKMYTYGTIFHMHEWHDGFLWKVVKARHPDVSMYNLNYARPNEEEVFGTSPLGLKMTHLKGPDKLLARKVKYRDHLKTKMSKKYLELNTEMHNKENYGASSHRKIPFVQQKLFDRYKGKISSVLDYGCGKGNLVREFNKAGLPTLGYDPAVPEFSKYPKGLAFDATICLDVMEHIEPKYVNNVLEDIYNLTTKYALFFIVSDKDTKLLPDGSNPHRMAGKSQKWWRKKLENTGFTIVEESNDNVIVSKPPSPTHYTFVCEV